MLGLSKDGMTTFKIIASAALQKANKNLLCSRSLNPAQNQMTPTMKTSTTTRRTRFMTRLATSRGAPQETLGIKKRGVRFVPRDYRTHLESVAPCVDDTL